MVVKLCHRYSLLNFLVAYLIGESPLIRSIVTFLIIAPYKCSYLLAYWWVSCW